MNRSTDECMKNRRRKKKIGGEREIRSGREGKRIEENGIQGV